MFELISQPIYVMSIYDENHYLLFDARIHL